MGIATALTLGTAGATDRYWDAAGAGMWSDPDNWRDWVVGGDPGVPQAGETIAITTEFGDGLWTITYDNSINPEVEFASLRIGEKHIGPAPYGDAQLRLENGHDLNVRVLDVGGNMYISGATGSIHHENGTVRATEILLATHLWDVGRYRICGSGARIEADRITVAYSNKGYFYHSAGSVNAGQLDVSYSHGDGPEVAYYELTGGVLNVNTNNAHIVGTRMGYYGPVEFVHNGGTFNAGGTVYLGEHIQQAHGTGEYRLSGTGALHIGGDFYVAKTGDGEVTFEQTGGSATVGGNLVVSWSADARSQVLLDGGTLTVSGGVYRVNGESLVRIDGGTLIVEGTRLDFGGLQVGYGIGTSGELTIKEHHTVTSTGLQCVASYGIGKVTQEGGSNTCASNLVVGTLGEATYKLQNGLLDVGGTIGIAEGDISVVTNCSGWLHQTGGELTCAGEVRMGRHTGCQGAITLDTGSFKGGAATVGDKGGGTFTQNAGNAVLDSMQIAAASSGNGAYSIGGGSLTVGVVCVGGRLDGDGGLPTPGGEASMTVTSTGYLDVTTGPLYVRGGNHLNLGGGTLSLPDPDALDATGGQVNFTFGTLVLRKNSDLESSFLDKVFPSQHEVAAGRHLKVLGQCTFQSTLKLNGGELSAEELYGVPNFTFNTGRFNKLTYPLVVDATGTFGATLTASTGQTYHAETDVEIGAGTLALDGGRVSADGWIDNQATGFVKGHGTLRAVNGRSGIGIHNAGTMQFTGGVTHVHGHLMTETGSVVEVASGATLRLHDGLSHQGTIVTAAGGRTTVQGTFDYDGAFTGAGFVRFEGLVNPRSVVPADPASLTFGGDAAFAAGSRLHLQLFGAATSAVERVGVAGALSAGGTLVVTLGNGFQPAAGDRFDLLDWGSLTGTFDGIHLPQLPNDLEWDTSALYSTGTITIDDGGAPATLPQPTYANVVYATVEGRPLHLDIYYPNVEGGPRPLMVWIHGGAWWALDKSSGVNVAEQVLERGMALASIDYRLTSDTNFTERTFPAQIHDVKGAVRFLRANAAKYKFDPERFGVWGSSAGGHLAALAGTSGGNTDLEGTVGGNLQFSSRVQVAGDYFGPVSLETLGDWHNDPGSPESELLGWELGDIIDNYANPASPYPHYAALMTNAGAIHHVSSDDPPFFIAHGTADPCITNQQSIDLATALQSAGVARSLNLVPGASHDLTAMPHAQACDFFVAVLGDRNMLTNGGFEYGSDPIPHAWVAGQTGGIPPAVLTWDAGQANSGSRSVKIEAAPGQLAWCQQWVAVTPGTVYELTGHVAWTNMTPGAGSYANLQAVFRDAGDNVLLTVELLEHTAGAREFDLDFRGKLKFRAPTGAATAAVMCFVKGQGIAWFDDVYFGPALAGSITGQVTRCGAPIAGARVWLHDDPWDRTHETWTDAAGAYALTDVPVSFPRYVVRASYGSCRPAAQGNVGVPANNATNVTLALPVMAPLMGDTLHIRRAGLGLVRPTATDYMQMPTDAVLDTNAYPTALAPYLQSNAWYTTGHPVITSLAERILESLSPPQRTNAHDVAFAAYDWIKRHVHYDELAGNEEPYRDVTAGVYQTVATNGWCYGRDFYDWFRGPVYTREQETGICVEHAMLATTIFRSLGIPARQSQGVCYIWAQGPSTSGWVTVSTSTGALGWRASGAVSNAFGNKAFSKIYAIDNTPLVYFDWDWTRPGLFREEHTWGEVYSGTPAGLAAARADMASFATNGVAPGHVPSHTTNLYYQVVYGGNYLCLDQMGTNRTLVFRYPLVMDSHAYGAMTNDWAWWCNHPECVSSTWVERVANERGTQHWVHVAFDFELDADGNGLPDWWEAHHSPPGVPRMDAAADDDGDGADNLAEYRAGTDPTNAASVFHVSDLRRAGNGLVTLEWTGADWKQYEIEVRTNLMGGDWRTTDSGLWTDASGTGIWTHAAAPNGPARFYRVRTVAPGQ